ncbi:MAG: HAMP domain-containing protein [Eubacteriales bacterium]|nr:HAMP domain-containing protein [Eubacteriales bacterium]
MLKSVFFRRLVIMLSVAMLIAAAVMLGGYVFLSKDVYADIKLDELHPSLDAAEQLAKEYMAGEIDKDVFERLAAKLLPSNTGTVLYLDAEGNTLFYVDSLLNTDAEGAKRLLYEQILSAEGGADVKQNRLRMREDSSALALGCPIFDDDGNILGAVVMLSSLKLVTNATGRMSMLVLMLTTIAIPVALIAIVWRAKNIVDPIRRMNDAAKAMAKGDFDIRLDEDIPGEVGELAGSLNNLCAELDHTIRQLSSEKGQLDQLLQSLTDGVVAIDEHGTLIHYNSAIMRMFGAVSVSKREELIPDEKVWKVFDEVFNSGKPQTITYPMAGDKVLWITISPVVTSSRERTGVVGLFKDMTEMERVEKLRRDYVANVSHELRTPLTAVRGLLEPLADGMVKDEADRQRYYKIMLHEVLRLSRLITDMMTLSRLQSGTEYMEITRVDVNELVQDIASAYSSTLADKGVNLVLDCPRPVPDAMTDPDRIEQVLVILLDNASRYTPKGGTITISARNAKEKIQLSVTDTGCGIPESDLPHIFERFYKVDKSHSEGGTGLGLSIAQFIMEKLGETISVESEVGKGTRFTLTLQRYVRNAIALGPAGEKHTRYGDDDEKDEYVPNDADIQDDDDVVDAHYEVIEQPQKAEKPPKGDRPQKTEKPQNKAERQGKR